MDISKITNTPDFLKPPHTNDQAPPETPSQADLTEDEHSEMPGDDTVTNSPAGARHDNETDGTLSDAGDDTEIEGSQNDNLDSQECQCKWGTCSAIATDPQSLTQHIIEEHVDPKDRPGQPLPQYRCHWESCTTTAPLRYKMICHVRKHTHDAPFFCFITDCEDTFVDASDLASHLSSVHNETRTDGFEWWTHIDQLKLDHMRPAPKKELRSIKRVTRMNEREMTRGLNAAKVDFLKVQNVTLDDIVVEPLKKKGRTANAEINTELRGAYNKANSEYKEKILVSAKNVFKEANSIPEMPSYTEIDGLDMSELQILHGALERRLLWSLEINELLNDELKGLKTEENKHWSKKELLMDAIIKSQLPSHEHEFIP